MRKILVTFATVFLPLLLSASAQAQADYGRSGWYVGAGASWGLFSELTNDLEDAFEDPTVYEPDVNVDSPFGFNVRGGYRVFTHLGVEAQFEYLPYVGVKMRNTLVPDDPKTKIAEFDFWTLTGNAKGYVSDGRFQPFGLLGFGMGYARTKGLVNAAGTQTDFDFAMRFGGGLDSWVTEDVAVAFDVTYVLPFRNLKQYDYFALSLGLKYRF